MATASVEQEWRPLMNQPLPLKTVMLLHDNNDSKKSVKKAGESASCVSTNDFWWGLASYVYQTSTMTTRGTQRLIGSSTEGVLWETDCNINGSNVNDIYSRHYIWVIAVPAPLNILSWDFPASKDICWWSQHSASQHGADRSQYARRFVNMLTECELWVIASVTFGKMPAAYATMVLDDVLEAQCFDP